MISIIVPVHNAEKTLDAAVRSVLQQTVRAREELEVILVDDGSSDESGLRCREYVRLSEPGMRIQLISMEDEGVSEARNRGIEAAGGELLTFLDADDAMDPAMLEVLCALHQKTGAQICGCGFCKVSEEEAAFALKEADKDVLNRQTESLETDLQPCKKGIGLLTGQAIVSERILQRDTRVWSKLFEREAIGDHRFEKGMTIGEDMLFVLSLLGNGTSYAFVEDPLYRYTFNPKGVMERPFTPSYMDQIRCWEAAEHLILDRFPSLQADSVAMGRLRGLQIVSDVLTASKIAKLPKKEREHYRPQLEQCRRKLAGHKRAGAASGIPTDYRVKSFLLQMSPSAFCGMTTMQSRAKEKLRGAI